jgi:tRNA-2-methylthio-N6-dimethylallyladenosine synthase
MQSGSDAVLQAMNRRYDRERFLDIVDYMRKRMPDVTLTSDIIVGFPGETEEDFEGTMDMLRRVRFDMLYSFIYSPRKGTPAAEMEQVPPEVKSARFERLLALQNEIGLEKNQGEVGVTHRILCEGVSKGNEALYAGRNEGGKIVFFEGAVPEDTGRFLEVFVERADPFSLYGSKK